MGTLWIVNEANTNYPTAIPRTSFLSQRRATHLLYVPVYVPICRGFPERWNSGAIARPYTWRTETGGTNVETRSKRAQDRVKRASRGLMLRPSAWHSAWHRGRGRQQGVFAHPQSPTSVRTDASVLTVRPQERRRGRGDGLPDPLPKRCHQRPSLPASHSSCRLCPYWPTCSGKEEDINKSKKT